MDLETLKEANDFFIKSVDVNLGRRQPCMVKGCTNKSFSRYEIQPQFHNLNPRSVCSSCTSILTRHSISTLQESEKYVQRVKPHAAALRKGLGYKAYTGSRTSKVAGYIQRTVGDQQVLITAFRDGKYMLLINGNSHGSGGYKAFLSMKLVTECAIRVINEHYTETNLMDFIQHGTPFVMP